MPEADNIGTLSVDVTAATDPALKSLEALEARLEELANTTTTLKVDLTDIERIADVVIAADAALKRLAKEGKEQSLTLELKQNVTYTADTKAIESALKELVAKPYQVNFTIGNLDEIKGQLTGLVIPFKGVLESIDAGDATREVHIRGTSGSDSGGGSAQQSQARDLISEHLTDQTIAAAADELHDFLGPHASRLDLANLRRIADRNRVAASGLGAVPASESGVVPPRPPNTTPPPTVFGPLDSGAWLRIRFDMVNPYAVRFAADHAADLVTVITDETAQTINQVVERSTAGDWDVFETSNRIRDVVGLNERWRNAVLNRYQGMIDRGAEPAFASRIAHTYAEQLRTKRAMMIARTETMRAANQGRLASYNAAAEAGLISVNAEKEWITAPQGAEVSVEGKGPAKGTKIVSGPCAACAPMNGRKVAGINQKFLLPNGRAVLTPPAHPHCRCTHLVLTPPPPVQTTPQPDVEIVRPW